MKQMSRMFLLLSITVLMAGCKLGVVVVEGGEVQSNGSGTCVAGTICIVDVTDPKFSEAFTAVPEEGWYFQKWNSGDRFLCGASTDLVCALSLRGYEDKTLIEDMVASSETFYLMPLFKQFSDMVTVDGRQWYQPYIFTGLSWTDINAVCPAGECAGVLNGYDLTGWTWASIEDVNDLFNYYIDSEVNAPGLKVELGPGPDELEYPYYSAWANAFFRDGWRPTNTYSNARILSGWMRNEMIYVGRIGDNVEEPPRDRASTSDNGVNGAGTPYLGGWFYRTP